MANLINGNHETEPGGWTKIRIETWVKGDPLPAIAALLDPAVRELALPGTEAAKDVTLDGLAVFSEQSHFSVPDAGTSPRSEER